MWSSPWSDAQVTEMLHVITLGSLASLRVHCLHSWERTLNVECISCGFKYLKKNIVVRGTIGTASAFEPSASRQTEYRMFL